MSYFLIGLALGSSLTIASLLIYLWVYGKPTISEELEAEAERVVGLGEQRGKL